MFIHLWNHSTIKLMNRDITPANVSSCLFIIHPISTFSVFSYLRANTHLLSFPIDCSEFSRILYKLNLTVCTLLVWPLSLSRITLRCIHVIVHFKNPFFSLLSSVLLYRYMSRTPDPIHLMIDIWVVSSMGLLQRKLIYIFMYKCLYGLMLCFFLLGKYLGGK